MLEAKALCKRYGSITAVDGVSFRAERGETLGLLGPNGAGKTTTVSLIAGLLRPDSGEVRIDGAVLRADTDPAKRRIGLVPQDLALFDELPARVNLQLFGALYDLHGAPLNRAMDEALELVELSDRARDKVKDFSGGMKRRLNLAAALLHDPEILLLDEPTVGVDPQSRNAIFNNLEVLKQRGKTLIYTTHYMEEAERLCDRLFIVDHGRVIANDTLRGLYHLLPASNILAIEPDRPVPVDELRAAPLVESVEAKNGTVRIGLRDLSTGAPAVLSWLAARNYTWQHVASERADLETVFLTLTGRSLRDQ